MLNQVLCLLHSQLSLGVYEDDSIGRKASSTFQISHDDVCGCDNNRFYVHFTRRHVIRHCCVAEQDGLKTRVLFKGGATVLSC